MRIYVTGRVTVETRERLVDAADLPGRQGRLVFVYLATEPRRRSRDELATLLWGTSPPDAWETALPVIVSKIRGTLAKVDLPPTILEGGDGSYHLRLPPGTWVDLRYATNALDRAEGAIRRGDPRAAWSDATVASTVFRRSFLAGETGLWVEQMRRDMYENQIRAFDCIARAWIALGEAGGALQAARRVVHLAPYRESAHCRLMEAHLVAGNHAEALRTYERLRNMLAQSMGIEPGPLAQELYETALG